MPTAVESSPRHQAEQSDGDRQRVLIADEILDDAGPKNGAGDNRRGQAVF